MITVSEKAPLVLSDVTSEALVMSSAGQHDIILLLSHMTVMIQVIGWKQPRWKIAANKLLAVSKRRAYCHAWLKHSFNLWSEDSEDIISLTQRFTEQAWWNLRNALLSAHGNMPAMSFWYTTWTETKIVCMINNGPFVLWPEIENDTHGTCVHYILGWPRLAVGALAWSGQKAAAPYVLLLGLILSPAQGPENVHKQSPCICPLINHGPRCAPAPSWLVLCIYLE